MAQFTVVEFPGQGTPHPVIVEGAAAKLREVIEKAGVVYAADDKREVAVNGEPTKNLDAEVQDGATVTVTDRIAAG